MPMKSKKQNAAMHAAEENPAVAKKLGIPQSVASKFIADSHGQKVSKLPERVKKARGGAVHPSAYQCATKW